MKKEMTANDENKLFEEIKTLIQNSRNAAYNAVSSISVMTYWNIGKKIVEEEQNGKERAQYGEHLIEMLAEKLTKTFGASFNKRNLQYFRKFYLLYLDLEIVNSCVHNLTWTHIRRLLSVANDSARLWYTKEASEQMWSVRTLDRNISTQYYERLLVSPQKEQIIQNMKKDAEHDVTPQMELLKSPVIAEFLGFGSSADFSEKDLESAIITHIRDFLMEMGRGFAFVARQQHIVTETQDFFLDLVFYNIELKCYVLIDLKIGKITHQDIGQMDMYIRMYDDLKRKENDNPTIGIVLCSETDKDIARYSILHDSSQIFMAKYMPFMPTPEELKAEIEKEKTNFYIQHPELKLEQ